ncbi:bifunctional metallophosphatase/5'-nucleotidase [Microlunatus sp. Y2014]|uniref:bifunctional metallophosphatase/5'-nucleotidase n=1 Tax=Microlunatus sp. Y2014 TaxID=3418488 RepID=UPI003DA79CEF
MSFNDFHGHLEADEDGVGGAAQLAGVIERERSQPGHRYSMTVSTGDIIGGSTFVSGLFQDEPAVEVAEAMGLEVATVGNHEFHEGWAELRRMIDGGCHPDKGCFTEGGYDGTSFGYLGANVVDAETGEQLLPGSYVKRVGGVQVGFVGVVTRETATLVSPAGIEGIEFTDEVEAANAEVAKLQARGIKSIVLLAHEGGSSTGGSNACTDLTGPIVDINAGLSAEVDAIMTGHTHASYVCTLADPNGEPRLVTQANNYGNLLTELDLVIDRRTKDVIRSTSSAVNHTVDSTSPRSAEVDRIVNKWLELSEPLAEQVVGSAAEDITGDSSGNRGIETPMGNLVADAILYGTSGANGGAQLAFMNVGGVRASLLAGDITYAEAYAVAPFNNQLVTLDMTGAQIKEVLAQQYVADRGRQMLALGVSEGFTYTWDPTTHTASNLQLNGQPMADDETYRVATLNFLADGGDGFTAFGLGTNRTGGPEDLANLVAYLQANPGITTPGDRVAGL